MKKRLKVFSIGAFCTVLLAGVILPFSACTPLSQESDINQTQTLNLDPENDEIIAYTNGGIPIRSHVLSGTESTSYQYITLGTYNGTPVNWIIVAVSDKGVADDVSPTGQAINTETDCDTIYGEQIDSSLEAGQVRLISECVFVNSNGFATTPIIAKTAVVTVRTGFIYWNYPCSTVYWYDPSPHLIATNYTDCTYSCIVNGCSMTDFIDFPSKDAVVSLDIPTNSIYQTYLNTNTLRIAKQIGTSTNVPYQIGDGTISCSIDSSKVTLVGGNAYYCVWNSPAYTGTSYLTATKGSCIDENGENADMLITSTGSIVGNVTYYSSYDSYYTKLTPGASTLNIKFTSIRPGLILDLDKL